jgi:WD40 repeat protein
MSDRTEPAASEPRPAPAAGTSPALSTVTGGADVPTGPASVTWPAIPGYEILAELGHGGMGVAYKARQVGLDRVVALKVLRRGVYAGREELARFWGEARTLAALHHPHIVQVYDVGEHEGLPYLVMEFVDAGSLARRVEAGPLPPRQAAELLEQVSRAIHAAHQQQIVHRDLKPANVLHTADGVPKVADFGLAKHLGRGTAHTQAGAILGTPGYMSPEQATGRSEAISPATDVYGLGAILYALLTGRPPFQEATLVDTLKQVRLGDPVPPRRRRPGVPRALEAVCLKCLQKDPARRYASAAELADDLGRFLRGEPTSAAGAAGLGRLGRRARRWRVAALVLAAVTLLGLAVLGRTWWRPARVPHDEDVSVPAGPPSGEEDDRAVQVPRPAPSRARDDRPVMWPAASLETTLRYDLVLRPDPGGPTSFVTALAFGRDGRTLYAAGWDKVARVWRADDRGRFVLQPRAYRVPIGPGPLGALNALAVSDDEARVAVGGLGVYRHGTDFTRAGWVFPTLGTLDATMLLDQGTIHVFNTVSGEVRLLRGHRGPIFALTFAPSRPGSPTLLVSAGRERKDSGEWAGTVRLWDVEAGKDLGVLFLPDPGNRRPSLAPFYRPAAPAGLHVALDWGDGRLRIWDVAGNKVREARGFQANPVAYFPEQDSVVTGAWGVGKARLRPWRVAPSEDPQPGPLEAQQGNGDVTPRALALASSGGNGGADHAALVTQKQDRGEWQYGLQILSLGAGDFGALKAGVDVLWRGGAKQPALATSLRGEYLAVAGNDDHVILVYRVADLLAGKPQPQVLRSAGTPIRYVGFVRKDRHLGLVLNQREKKEPGSEPRQPDARDLVFDLGEPGLVTDTTGWWSDAPDPRGWRTEQPDKTRPVLAVFQGERKVTEVKLAEGHQVTDFALLPPLPPLQKPILAVAHHKFGEPNLSLYNASTGELVRELVGHSDRIHCLAFSRDGRLLVSASEDQTVCVWSLTSLGRVLGQAGLLRGVAVTKDGQGNVVVGRIDEDSPARGQLHDGDVLEGLVVDGQLRRLDDPLRFYDAVNQLRPGTTVALQVRGRGAVQLPVGQGVDQRAPLLSLLLTRPESGKDWGWVEWNPLGPYEASDAQAERRLGWHFNTHDPQEPARFAPVDGYHAVYYRPGLLRQLIEDGRIPPPPPPRKPRLSLGIDGEAGATRDGRSQVVLRRPQAALDVWIKGRPLTTLDRVTYRVDEGEAKDFDLDAAGELLSAPLALDRGEHRIVVTAHAPDLGPEGAAEPLLVRYQPPPPRLRQAADSPATVRDAVFRLDAHLLPGPGGGDVDVTFFQNRKPVGPTRTYHAVPADGLALSQTFELEAGKNHLLEVVAVNRDALAGYEQEETARLAAEVFRVRKADPPRIVLKGVLPDGRPADQLLDIQPGRPVRVTVPAVQILGEINAADNLVEAGWLKDGVTEGSRLSTFAEGRKTLPVMEKVELGAPGSQTTVRFRARTAASDEAEREVTLDFRPPAPAARITAPEDGQEISWEAKTTAVEIRAEVSLPADPYPYGYEVKVLHDGKEEKAAPQVDRQKRTLTAVVPLHAGGNRLEVQCTTAWGETSTSRPVQVWYSRPPVVVALDSPNLRPPPAAAPNAPKWTSDAFINLKARVLSPLPLRRESVKVQVNGEDREVSATVSQEQQPQAWVVDVPRVPLERGTGKGEATTNVVRLGVSNQEGESREFGTLEMVHEQPKEPPLIAILEPEGRSTVLFPDVTVRYRVQSPSPLKEVRLIPGPGQPVPADVSRAGRGEGTSYVLEVEVPIHLQRGVTTLRVEATTVDGASGEATAVVTCPEGPVAVVLDSLSDQTGQVVPEKVIGGRLIFPKAMAAGRVRLKGQVVWDESTDERLKKAAFVRVYVNGFQQRPARLAPPAPGGRRRAFEADLVLTREKDNQVWLALPDLQPGEGAPTQFQVDCRAPEKDQRLHLLAVSPDETDERALKEQVFRAFGIAGPEDQLRTAAFQQVYLYGPQVGHKADRIYLNSKLAQIKGRIMRLIGAGVPGNDLVVIYYRGKEKFDEKGNYFPTGPDDIGPAEQNEALRPDELADLFRDTPGAFVLLLDVDRDPDSARVAPAKDPLKSWASPNTAVLRYAWAGEPAAPPRLRLLGALQDEMPRAATMLDLADGLRQVAARSPDFDKSLIYDAHVPNGLKGVPLNRGP